MNQVEFIFIRSANQPTTPTATNYPALPSSWYDDIADVPSGSNAIWVSKGTTTFSIASGVFKYITTWQAATRIEGSDGAPGNDGDDGASNFTVFQESNTPPSTPSAGTSNPPTSSWYSTLSAARNAVAGDGLVWFSVGTKPGTSNTITWSVPIRYVEEYDHIGGTKPPGDANKFTPIADSTEGRWRFSINDGSTTDVDVFSSGERTKLDRLREGKIPTSDSVLLENTTASQAKATAAENAAKLQESTNRVTFPTDNTEGRFSFSIGGGTAVVNDVFSSGERTKLANLRAGTLPGGTGTLESTAGSQTKATAAQTAAAADATTKSNTAESNAAATAESKVNNRLSATEKNRLNAGSSPDNTKSFDNAGTITGNVTGKVNNVAVATVAAGAAAGATANQDSTSAIRAGTTKANVGLGNVDNTSDATILAGNLTGTVNGTAAATIKSGAALGASSNQDSTSAIRAGTTKANVGLGDVPNLDMSNASNIASGTIPVNRTPTTVRNSTIAINATTGIITGITGDGVSIRNDKTTKANVGLGNVDNTSDATILAGNLTGTVNGTAASVVKAGAAAGATANQDSTSAIRAGTTKANVGLGNVTNESKATMFAAPTFTGTVSGVSKSHVGLGNVDNTSDATVLAGNLTGTVNGTAVATIKSGAAAGATANQDSTSAIRAGTTKANVGLSAVPNVDTSNATNITSGTLPNSRIDVDVLAVKFLADVDTQIYDHNGTAQKLTQNGFAQVTRSQGGGTAYSGICQVSFIGKIRDGARYVVNLSAVLGNVNGWKVQISTNGFSWSTASGGPTSIYWNAGTYRGYTYTYSGIASIPSGSSNLYFRIYTGTQANYTYASLNAIIFNTG